MRALRYVLALGLVVVFVGLQFIPRPPLTHPPVTADLQVPPDVKKIFVTSCYDCHSNETKLLWFDHLQPAYSLVVDDVNKGRARLNFSDFGKLPPDQQQGFLFESFNQIQYGFMPPVKYTLLHPGAIISRDQMNVIKDYLKTLETDKVSDAEHNAAADAQYDQWIKSHPPATNVAPALNAFAFPTGYQDWQMISASDRSDNGTMRVILGNDVAIEAVNSGHINPWPDGAMFAKVAWYDRLDAQGNYAAGAFKQVEFMRKDSKGHASTLGWEFGRWLGPELKPYGQDATFAESCVHCHTPMQANDYVFTMPIKVQR